MIFENIRTKFNYFLVPLIFASTLSLTSCGVDPEIKRQQDICFKPYITLTVLEKSPLTTSFQNVTKWTRDIDFGSPIKYETTEARKYLSIKGKTNDSSYSVLDFISVDIFDGPTSTASSLDKLIDSGSVISFPAGNVDIDGSSLTGFSYIQGETNFERHTEFGNKRADRVMVFSY
jgi:hypothetical protein